MTDDTIGSAFKAALFQMVAEKRLTAESALEMVRRLETTVPELDLVERTRPRKVEGIAVIGMAGRFAQAPDLSSFWSMIAEGRDGVIELPEQRRAGGAVERGGFLPDHDLFDPLFFKISPTEAALMDPQQRIFLEQAYVAFEDAGYAEPDLSGLRCGVFVGAGSGDYARQLDGVGQGAGPQALMGNVASILSARISYFLNLKGPSLAIDTACSSSLVAVHLACEALRSGSCEMALAGGVCVVNTTLFLTAMREAGMLSPSAACHTFDAAADGFVVGEGAGAVILKPLERALADGDHIYGVIRGSAINQDGRTNGITAPSAPSQAALEREVYEAAGIDPASIGYIEAHGTGTPLGDPIEIEALTSAFRAWTDRRGFCGIGSVKTNIGHALTAAGIAGLIKVLLMLRHGQIPPSLHFKAPNPRIHFASTPFFVADEPRPWTRLGEAPRRAAISSFGFSGTNAHILVEEAPARPVRVAPAGPFVFPVSARSEAAVARRCGELAQALMTEPRPDLRDVAYTLAVGRTHWSHRAAFMASQREALVRQLIAQAEGRTEPRYEIGDPETAALTKEFVRGGTVDWRSLAGPLGGRRVPLPPHGLDRQRYSVQLSPVSRPDPLAAVTEAVQGIQAAAGAGLDDLGQAFGGVEAWGRRAAARALAPLLPGDRRALTREALRRHLGVVEEARGLWGAILDLLARDGIVAIEGDLVRLPDAFASAAVELEGERKKLVAEEPAVAPFVELLERTTAALPKVLRGEMKGTEALFPEGRFELVERVYRGNRLADYFNRIMATAVAAAPTDGELRVLEIGAGTGGATAGILQALTAAGRKVAYDYTDVSLGFTQLGRSRFAADYSFITFKTLDIERDPLEQGFEADAYDVVVASNVLHATRDIGVTLARVATLTRPGGLVLVNEVTALQDFASLTFGLTEGWWAFEDGERRLRHAPLLDVPGWRRSLAEAGFDSCRAFGLPGEPEEKAGQAVIVAQREAVAEPVSRPAASAPRSADPAPIAAVAATEPAPGSDLETLLRREVAAILTMAEAAIDPRGRFMDYGVDSILGLQLVGRLNSLLGTDLRPTVLFDHPTVLDLARHLKSLPGVRLPVAETVPAAPASSSRQIATIASPSDRQIAVIGMAGRFASTDNLAEFQQLLAGGRSGIGDLSARWGVDLDEVERERGIDARYLRWGGGLRHVDLFDPLFFRMSGKEAELTDPQHRILLTEAWRALEDAGYGEPALDGARCGIFVGCHGGDYTHRMAEVGIVPEAFAFMGNAASILAARIAYILNLKGPSLAVDTACSSSLVAVHLACQSLLAGECDMALAGGVFINTTIGFNAAASKAGMLSPEGRCKTFDADADGFVPGEGAGVIVLKPLARALEDGDHVEAVILASAVNQDGKTNGITAPSMESQTRLELEVYEKAGIDPSAIGYVEAHGTGTRLGDPIEIEGLTRAFRRYGEARQVCPIGSVKTNVGHAAHAAGIAGLLKVLLQFRHSELYPSLNFRTPNPDLHLGESPFYVLTEHRPWPRGEQHRLAAISSFGFSGTNVHMVLAEAPDLPKAAADDRSWRLIPVSAKTPVALRQRLTDLRDWLEENDAPLGDVSHTLAWGRSHFGERWAALVRGHAELVGALDRALASPGDELLRLSEPMLPDEAAAAPPGPLMELARRYLAGEDTDFQNLNPGARRRSLPAYPFEEQSYWITPLPDAAPRVSLFAPVWEPQPIARAVSQAPRAIRLLGGDRVPGLAGRLRAAAHRVEDGVGSGGTGAPDLTVDLRALDDASGALRSLYDLVKDELRQGGATVPPILFLHDGRPMSEAAAAFTPSLGILDGRLRVVLIRLETPLAPAAELAELMLAEAAMVEPGAAKEIAYRDGVRQRRRLIPVKPRTDKNPAGGVWLITGGAGSLGLILARHLVEHHRARVALVGRSRLEGAAAELVASLGHAVRYWTADVTDPDALAGTIAAAASEMGPITGVIHAAGVAAGPVLMEGDWAEFERVLAPKALGLAALDRAVAAQPLEHFVVFSSLAAELGDFGQCAYAAANIVASRFAETREDQRRRGEKRGRTVALCWPLWREGRRVLSAAGEELYLKTIGMPFLETADGLAAFDAALGSDVAQLVVIPGDPARAEALLSHEPERRAVEPPPLPLIEPEVPAMAPATSTPTPDEDLLPAIRRRLTGIVSRLLKIDESRLGPGVGFGDFGFDSIALKDFAVEIGRAYGVVVTPAVFFAHGTIGALAQHLLSEHGRVVARVESPEPKATEAPRPPVSPPRPSAEPPARVASAAEEAVAIIGMAGRLPQSPDLDAFWRHLAAGHDLVGEIPKDRWTDGSRAPRGGFIEDVDRFDAAFFHIAPREAVFMDPQHRLAIETAWHCVEDAGVRMSDLAGRPIGVFFAQQVNEYGRLMADQAGAEAQIALGNIATMLPNRISYLFDLQGPSEAIDTACSGALVAVHRAVRALLDEECELAIAGGVSLMLDPQGVATTTQLGVLSPDGRCRTFDAKANGYVKGEGVGAVLLKPLAAALRDGDPIRAVIRGSAVNHGGHAYSLTAPNAQAQTALVRAALKRAGVEGSSIGYVEAHGTGTELGDPVEVTGLKAAFGGGSTERPWCLLGSVKTNIGHLEPAAGIAGLMKTVLALENGTIPASLHVDEPSPHLELEKSPFAIATETGPWRRPRGADGEETPRRAGVSAFGFGGTNAHVVLEEAPELAPVAAANETPQLIVLSARDAETLARLVERLAAHVEDYPDLGVADIALTLQMGRMAMSARAAFVHRPGEALADRLRAAARAIASRGQEAGVHLGTAEEGEDILGSDTESAAFLRSLVAGGKLERIAALWVKGAGIDWQMLGSAPARRVSLPGYPFARTRHWVPARRAETVSAPKQAEPAPVVPPETEVPGPPPPATAAPDALQDQQTIRDIVGELAAGVLYLDVGAIDRDADVADLGFDSILVVELVKMLNDRLGTAFAATRLYDFRTLNGLADHLHALMTAGQVGRKEPSMQEAAAAAPEPTRAAPSEDTRAPADGEAVRDWLRAALARVLYLSEEAIDERTSFAELGLDSILAVELAKAINDHFATDLPATRIFDQPNVAALAQQIEERLGRSAPTSVTADPALVGQVLAALRGQVAAALSVEADSIDVRAPLDGFAIDPPAAAAIVDHLRSTFGLALELAEVGGCRDLEAVAALIASRTTTTAPERPEAPPVASAPPTADPEAERILDVIREQVRMVLPDVPPEAVTLESSLAELGANSMDRVEVATYSMEQLAVVVPPAAMRDVANVGDLVEILRRYAHAA